MNRDQATHVGMINSFNLITGKATFEQIIDAGIGVFSHLPEEYVEIKNIEFIILYFEIHEMYEYCAELKKYIEDNYNEDGTLKQKDCECEYPDVKNYSYPMSCAQCKKELKW